MAGPNPGPDGPGVAGPFGPEEPGPRTDGPPVAPYLAAALIILFTPVFFFFGVIVYRILRPSETVAEARLVEAQCDAALPACAPLLARAGLIRGAMQALLDQNIDPAHDPQRAKNEVYKMLLQEED